MRRLLLSLIVLFLLPAAADAQRRYRVVHDDERGTDLQVLARGLNVNGVGLRFWLGERTAVATRLNFDFTDFDSPDGTALGLDAGVAVESHMRRGGRVHPYFTLGGHVGVFNFDGNAGDNTRTVFGGHAGLGAEARLVDGLSLGAQYALRVDAVTGDDALPQGPGGPGTPRLNVGLGGVPTLALSFRF
jgi:opacity protein-like surface antigen